MATVHDERGDKGEGRGYRTCRCMHGSNRRTDRDTERDRWRERALETLRRCGRDANGRRRLNLTIIVRPISHPDIDLNDRYPEIRISIHNTTAISYCRILIHDTLLKSDAFRTGISISSVCGCGHDSETVEHFILHCPKYDSERSQLIDMAGGKMRICGF